jgi:hypothetical protein
MVKLPQVLLVLLEVVVVVVLEVVAVYHNPVAAHPVLVVNMAVAVAVAVNQELGMAVRVVLALFVLSGV